MASSTPPMYTDTPLALIPTPKFETGQACNTGQFDDPFTTEASHMAISHNAFIRGFNSIYQQARRISAADKPDFVGYCLAWVECVATHHRYEETDFFPNVDRAAGREGLMGGAVREHEAFYGGMERMRKYLLEKGGAFSGTQLVAIMDSFKEPLHDHLKAEPGAIVALAKYSTPENPIDILGIAGAAGKCGLLSFPILGPLGY
ncbi:hypothetical protein SLS62_000655 [Diatrype stigma]|uniref:Hemerythrin-like domain-containing protein n=1 Tax=Diatrype stigma TaxID=117547 RepID=A0AAN9UZB7_9PEZI